ncbi:hypothetical protein [Methylobacterium sp. J-070]|nr:hypothetical protein [Methylobacterium sp. J-070]
MIVRWLATEGFGIGSRAIERISERRDGREVKIEVHRKLLRVTG